jgi:hypothetical protein
MKMPSSWITSHSKCNHLEPLELSYRDFIDDAIKRVEKGENQLKCPHCLRYIWASDYLTEL